jgi:hypothetical protein
LGVISFALLTILALLPIGLKMNHISTEETRATYILTTLEADLRNTYPGANGGKSTFYGLAEPYMMNGAGRVVLNSNLTTNSASSTASPPYSVGLDGNEKVTATTTPPPPYQASVIYNTNGAPPGSVTGPMQIEARLIVNWPYVNTSNPVLLTSPTNVSGFVESYVSFPAP